MNGVLDLEAGVLVLGAERLGHHETIPYATTAPEERPDDRGDEVVRHALEREHLDEVPAPRPDRAGDARARRAARPRASRRSGRSAGCPAAIENEPKVVKKAMNALPASSAASIASCLIVCSSRPSGPKGRLRASRSTSSESATASAPEPRFEISTPSDLARTARRRAAPARAARAAPRPPSRRRRTRRRPAPCRTARLPDGYAITVSPGRTPSSSAASLFRYTSPGRRSASETSLPSDADDRREAVHRGRVGAEQRHPRLALPRPGRLDRHVVDDRVDHAVREVGAQRRLGSRRRPSRGSSRRRSRRRARRGCRPRRPSPRRPRPSRRAPRSRSVRIVWLIVSPVTSAAAMIVVPSISPRTIRPSARAGGRRCARRAGRARGCGRRARRGSRTRPRARSRGPASSVSSGMPKSSFTTRRSTCGSSAYATR